MSQRAGSRHCTAAVVTIVICLLMTGAGLAADEILTNELVIKLVGAGLSEGVIIEKIQSSPTRFDLDLMTAGFTSTWERRRVPRLGVRTDRHRSGTPLSL